MTITYECNHEVVHIAESANDSDVEFDIRMIKEEYGEQLKQIQQKFEENNVLTDVMFYPYANQRYRVIVRQDYYVDFILALMKYRLLKRVEWR